MDQRRAENVGGSDDTSNMRSNTATIPVNVVQTFSWKCPTCGEWEHGYETPALAAQELFEHEDERHD